MTDFADTFAGGGSWKLAPTPPADRAKWNSVYKQPTDSVSVTLICGCTIHFGWRNAPVRAWECEHGNYIRCVER